MKKVKIGMVLDMMGSLGREPEEEAEDIIKHLRAMGLDCELKIVSSASNEVTDEAIDLLIVDYGGMLPGCYSLQVSHIRGCVEWAREHPGKLMVIWTDFTKEIYEDELVEEFGDLDNVRFDYGDDGCVDELIEWYHPGHNISKTHGNLKTPGVR